MNDPWLGGSAYERFMGRWSTLVARQFLSWFGAGPGLAWLDVGSGTGALTRCVLDQLRPSRVLAIDSSIDLLSQARRSITNPGAYFGLGLAEALPVQSDWADAVVSGLVLNFVPQPRLAVSEMLRVAKPGGRIGMFVWDYADGMRMLRHFWDAAVELDRSAIELDEALKFAICREGQLQRLALEAGLKQVAAAPIEIMTVFRGFDDYWEPFLGGVGPAARYLASLTEAHRAELESRLRKMLPTDPNGTISLPARAWAVSGTA